MRRPRAARSVSGGGTGRAGSPADTAPVRDAPGCTPARCTVAPARRRPVLCEPSQGRIAELVASHSPSAGSNRMRSSRARRGFIGVLGSFAGVLARGARGATLLARRPVVAFRWLLRELEPAAGHLVPAAFIAGRRGHGRPGAAGSRSGAAHGQSVCGTAPASAAASRSR